MVMLYRHHVEFGVGHGVSLHADCPTGFCDKAHRLSTCVVPDYEVPRTTPPTVADWPKLDGLVLDMKLLGEMPTAELDSEIETADHGLRRMDQGPPGRTQEARPGYRSERGQVIAGAMSGYARAD